MIVNLAPERREPEAFALLDTLRGDEVWDAPRKLAPLSHAVARRALETVRAHIPPEHQARCQVELLPWLPPADAAEVRAAWPDESLEPSSDSSAPPSADARSPAERLAAAEIALRRAREATAETAQSGLLIFELLRTPPAVVSDAHACGARLVEASRAPLAARLWAASRWAQVALMCQTEWGWAYLIERTLTGHALPELAEPDVREACRVTDAAGLAAWFVTHPPDPDRLWSLLEPAEQEALVPHLRRAALHDAEWLKAIEEYAAAEPVPADSREALEALEATMLETETLAPRAREPNWQDLAWRWLRTGDGERALAAAHRISFDQYRWDAVFGIGLALRRGDAIHAALVGMSERYDPSISLFPAAGRAVAAGFRAEVLAVARAQKDPAVHTGLLSQLGEVASEELARDVRGLIAKGGQIRDNAFGRAAPHLDLEARARMWGYAFSEAQYECVLPFSWDTTGALAVAASLLGGVGLPLASWVARLRDG